MTLAIVFICAALATMFVTCNHRIPVRRYLRIALVSVMFLCACVIAPAIASAYDEIFINPSGDTHVKLTSTFEGVTGDKDAINIPFSGEDGGSGSVRVPTNWKATIQYHPAITWEYTYKCGITVDGKLEGYYAGSFYFDTGMKATVATPAGISAIRKAMVAPFKHVETVRLYITVANATGCEYLGDVKRSEWRDAGNESHVDFRIPDPVVMNFPEAKAGLFRVFGDMSRSMGITVIEKNLEYSITADYGPVLVLTKSEEWTPVELRVMGQAALNRLHRYAERADDTSIYGFTRPGSDDIYVTAYELATLDNDILVTKPPINLKKWAGRKNVRVIKPAAKKTHK